MKNIITDKNEKKIVDFLFNSDKFVAVYGEKGLGKSYLIEKCLLANSLSLNYSFIKFESQKNYTIPLFNLCNSLKIELTQNIEILQKEITSLDNYLILIENINLFQQDEKNILMSSLKYLSHKYSNIKIIFEYDNLDYLEYDREIKKLFLKYPIYEFRRMSPVLFSKTIKKIIKGNSELKNQIIKLSKSNFETFEKIIFKLKLKNYITQKNDIYYINKTLTLEIFDKVMKEDIFKEYSSLTSNLKIILDYSSLISPFFLPESLEIGLSVDNANDKIKSIYDQTNLIIEQLDKPIDYLFESVIYKFLIDDIKELISNQLDDIKKYQTYLKMSKYIENKLKNEVDKNKFVANIYEFLGDLCIKINDSRKAFNYYKNAADNYNELRLYEQSIQCYNICLKIKKEKNIYQKMLRILEYQKKEDDMINLIEDNKLFIYDANSKYYEALAYYRKGFPTKSLNILKNIKERNVSQECLLLINSLYSSIYDWMNNHRKMKKYYKKCLYIINENQHSLSDYNINLIYKKYDLYNSFIIPEVREKMENTYNYFLENNYLNDAYEIANNIGIEYIYINDIIKAFKYIRMSVDGLENIKSPCVYVGYNNLGIIHMLNDDYSTALGYFKKINLDIIEDFCKWCILINIDMCKIKTEKSIDISKYDEINFLKQKVVEDNRIPAVLFQILLGLFYLHSGQKNKAKKSFITAYRNCPKENDNFEHLKKIALLLEKEENLSDQNKITDVCYNKKIIFAEIMFWGN